MQDLGSGDGMKQIVLVDGQAHRKPEGPESECPDWKVYLYAYWIPKELWETKGLLN